MQRGHGLSPNGRLPLPGPRGKQPVGSDEFKIESCNVNENLLLVSYRNNLVYAGVETLVRSSAELTKFMHRVHTSNLLQLSIVMGFTKPPSRDSKKIIHFVNVISYFYCRS